MNERGMNKNWNRGKRLHQQQQKDFKISKWKGDDENDKYFFFVTGVDRKASTIFNPIHANLGVEDIFFIIIFWHCNCIGTVDYCFDDDDFFPKYFLPFFMPLLR